MVGDALHVIETVEGGSGAAHTHQLPGVQNPSITCDIETALAGDSLCVFGRLGQAHHYRLRDGPLGEVGPEGSQVGRQKIRGQRWNQAKWRIKWRYWRQGKRKADAGFRIVDFEQRD